jgi:hypothetical protein
MLVLKSGVKKNAGHATVRNLSFLDVVRGPVLKLIICSTPFPLQNIFFCTRISSSKDCDG